MFSAFMRRFGAVHHETPQVASLPADVAAVIDGARTMEREGTDEKTAKRGGGMRWRWPTLPCVPPVKNRRRRNCRPSSRAGDKVST
jgi:hypothetical protein